jgi:hypothetical protein
VNTILGDIQNGVTTRSRVAHFCEHYSFVSSIEPHKVEEALQDSDWVVAMQEELNNFTRNEVWHLVPRLSVFRDRGVPKPTSECRRVPQPRWVDARPSAKGGSEVAGDGHERGGNPAAFVFVPRPGRVRLQ